MATKKAPGKVIITPRPPVGSGDQNGEGGAEIVMKSNIPPELKELANKAPKVGHEEALAVDQSLPKVAAKKANAIKKEALDPKKKTVDKKVKKTVKK